MSSERVGPAPSARHRAVWMVAAAAVMLSTAALSYTAGESESAELSGLFSDYLTVRVLEVDVVVTDSTGRPVSGLRRDRFRVTLNGELVPITYFYGETERVGQPGASESAAVESEADPVSIESDPLADVAAQRPSYVVILIDHTRLRAHHRRRAFSALRDAIDGLGEDDRVGVIGIEGGLVFYSDFLTDRSAVHEILDEVSEISLRTDVNEIERREIFGELARGISGGIQARASQADPSIIARIRSYAAEEHDRGIRSLQQIETVVSTLTGLPGSKTLIYLGEGIPTRPGEGLYVEYRNRFSGPERGLPHQDLNTDYTRAIGHYDLAQPMRQLAKAANRAGVKLYAIDAAGGHGAEVRSALTEQGATSEAITTIDENYREPLEYASKATGGRLLVASGQLREQLVEMVGGLRTYYSLGFDAPEDWRPGSEHDLKIEVRGRGLSVRHPERIGLPEPDEREAGATTAALMYGTIDNPLAVQATPGSVVPRDDGAVALPIWLAIPVERLELVPVGDSQVVSLSIYVSIEDAVGNPGRVQKVPFELKLPNEAVERAIGDFAHYSLPLVVRKGDQHAAVGVRDNVSGVFSVIRVELQSYSRF